jgi:DNA-binding transcriptional ArsR family regulator
MSTQAFACIVESPRSYHRSKSLLREPRLHIPQPTVSKHLRVLRDAGFVESTVDAQRRLYRLNPESLHDVDAWLAEFRRLWSVRLNLRRIRCLFGL